MTLGKRSWEYLNKLARIGDDKEMKNFKTIFPTAGFLFAFAFVSVLLTAQSVNAQPQPAPGTILITTFENGTSKVLRVDGTDIQFLNGIGVLIADPNAANYEPQPISTTLVNSITQQLSYVIKFILERPNLELPPLPQPQPEPEEPLPYCDTPEGEAAASCWDRDDFDEDTGLFPCNDGTQREDPSDCPDATKENDDDDDDQRIARCLAFGSCPDGDQESDDNDELPQREQDDEDLGDENGDDDDNGDGGSNDDDDQGDDSDEDESEEND